MLNKKVLFREKIVEMMFELLKGERIETQLSKKSELTYSHVINLLQKMEKEGIVTREKEGRQRNITLTVKGLGITKHLKEMYKKLGYLKEDDNTK